VSYDLKIRALKSRRLDYLHALRKDQLYRQPAFRVIIKYHQALLLSHRRGFEKLCPEAREKLESWKDDHILGL
jgi:hypothetical protein